MVYKEKLKNFSFWEHRLRTTEEYFMSNLNQIQKDLAIQLASQSDARPFLIFTIDNILLAMDCKYVAAIEKSGVITEVASSSRNADVKGISHYKNEAVNIINLRAVFGYASQLEQIENQIDLPARIQDHLNYVDELERCAAEGKPFKLTNDPHACRFGKWYYEYRKTARSAALNSLLAKIEEPHEKVHEYSNYVNEYISNGNLENAKKYAEEIREKYCKDVISYIESINNMLHERVQDLVIIANVNNKKIGFLVDTVESVDSLAEIQPLPDTTAVSSHIKRLGLLRNEAKSTSDIVLITELESFV